MISIIIPVLNEERALPETLEHVFRQNGDFEIIIVDGGSDDRTCELAGSYDDILLLKSKRGRAIQMNTGAEAAKGQWLLFLHADTLLPGNALRKIRSLNDQIKAGCFHQQFSGQHYLLRLISKLHNWRCRRSRIIYGDQAMFVRREMFDQLGGFPQEPILEDVIFSEELVKVTRPVLLEDKVITDSRKFVQRGIWRSFAEVFIIMSCYELRLPVVGRDFFSPVR